MREKEKSQKKVTDYMGLFASNGFGNLQSFASRKKWLEDPANAEYVKHLSFNSKTYKGTAKQNKELLDILQAQKLYLIDEENS